MKQIKSGLDWRECSVYGSRLVAATINARSFDRHHCTIPTSGRMIVGKTGPTVVLESVAREGRPKRRETMRWTSIYFTIWWIAATSVGAIAGADTQSPALSGGSAFIDDLRVVPVVDPQVRKSMADGTLSADAMDPTAARFAVSEGRQDAPHRLVFVHGFGALGYDFRGVNEARLYALVAAGTLRIDHHFRFGGGRASLYGNLALICSGPESFRVVRTALDMTEARDALARLEGDNPDIPGAKALLASVFTRAGLDPGLVDTCVFDRDFARAYLEEISRRYDDRRSLFSTLTFWPAFVLDGTLFTNNDIRHGIAAIEAETAPPAGAH